MGKTVVSRDAQLGIKTKKEKEVIIINPQVVLLWG